MMLETLPSSFFGLWRARMCLKHFIRRILQKDCFWEKVLLLMQRNLWSLRLSMTIFWSTCFTKYSFSINQINRFALSLQLKTECGSQFTNKLEGTFKVWTIYLSSFWILGSIFLFETSKQDGSLLSADIIWWSCHTFKNAFMTGH